MQTAVISTENLSVRLSVRHVPPFKLDGQNMRFVDTLKDDNADT